VCGRAAHPRPAMWAPPPIRKLDSFPKATQKSSLTLRSLERYFTEKHVAAVSRARGHALTLALAWNHAGQQRPVIVQRPTGRCDARRVFGEWEGQI